MPKESKVDSSHVRVTSSDGRTSYLYEIDGRGDRNCVEVADHYKDGTTKAYEADKSVVGQLFHGGKGKEK